MHYARMIDKMDGLVTAEGFQEVVVKDAQDSTKQQVGLDIDALMKAATLICVKAA